MPNALSGGQPLPLLVLLLSIALFVALQLVLTRTRFGRIVRATADNRDIVRLMGVNPTRVYNVVMGLSLAVAMATMLFAPTGVWPMVRDRLGVEWLSVRRRPPSPSSDVAPLESRLSAGA